MKGEEAGEDLSRYDDAPAYTKGVDYYITAAWGEDGIYGGDVPSSIEVGNEDPYSVGGVTYVNQPLDSGTEYTIFTRYDIENDAGTEVS